MSYDRRHLIKWDTLFKPMNALGNSLRQLYRDGEVTALEYRDLNRKLQILRDEAHQIADSKS